VFPGTAIYRTGRKRPTGVVSFFSFVVELTIYRRRVSKFSEFLEDAGILYEKSAVLRD
jgi:hypothetical protein